MMALRVLNQISSKKLPKPGSIRSISADRSSTIHPPLIQPLKEVPFESRFKLFCARKRSHSLPTKCDVRNYSMVYGDTSHCVIEEKEDLDEELEVFKNKLPSVLDRTHLPINYEQFSTKRSDEIENITQLAKECYKKFQLKPFRPGYRLKDSRKSKKTAPEVEDAIKKRYMHNDYISGSDLQPKNLSPFDEINFMEGETAATFSSNPPNSYYYAKSKFLEKSKKISQRRNYTTDIRADDPEGKEELGKSYSVKAIDISNMKNPNVIKVKAFSKSKTVPFKSYGDHVKEALSNQPIASTPVPFNQKRTYSMIPRAKTYKLDANGVPTPVNIRQKTTIERSSPAALSAAVDSVCKYKEDKSIKRFEPISIKQFNLEDRKSKFIYDPKVDPYSVLDEKRNVRHKFLPKISNEDAENAVRRKFHPVIEKDDTASAVFVKIPTNNSVAKDVIYINPAVYSKIDDIRVGLNKTLPIEKLANNVDRFHTSSFQPVETKTITTPTARKLSIKHSTHVKPIIERKPTRNMRQSATYAVYNNMMFGPVVTHLSTSCGDRLQQACERHPSDNSCGNINTDFAKSENLKCILPVVATSCGHHPEQACASDKSCGNINSDLHKSENLKGILPMVATSYNHRSEKVCEHHSSDKSCGSVRTDLPKSENFKSTLPMAAILRRYSTSSSDPCKTEKKESKAALFTKSKYPKEILEQHKLELFDGICENPEKKYEKNKPCNCVEPYLPTKLPKMKRLQKKYPTDVDEYREPPKECSPFPCPPRADANLKEKKKDLPPPPCSDCHCIEPPPLDSCNPLPRLTKRLVPMDMPKVCEEDPCPERADDKLVEKKKCLKPLPKEPLDCKCIEPYLPTKLPPMKRLEKKLDIDEAPMGPECDPPPCPSRADDGLNLYRKKVLPKIDCNDCPCVEPSPLDECAPLPRLKKRPVFQDTDCIIEDPCPLKADDVCGYEVNKKKLKPLLPCLVKPTGCYKNYSTMTRSFLNIQVAGLKTSAPCENKDVEFKADHLPICPPDPCKKVIPLCPPKKEGVIDGLLQKLINYFKARPNCPAPDEWKKRYLRDKAEKAAKAAGLELCEPRSKPGMEICEPKPKSLQKDSCSGGNSVRHYSSSSGAWNKDTTTYFTNDAKLANEMELKQLIYRILKLLRVDDKENTSETCDQLLKEFMDLSEEEFQYIKAIISDAHESLLYNNTIKLGPQRKKEIELEHKMIETLDLFCKKASYLRNITYLEYEELEKMKTRTMQNKLDEMLKKYKVEDEC